MGIRADPLDLASISFQEINFWVRRTFKHVKHSLRDDEATGYVYEGEQYRSGTESLWDGLRDISTAQDEETTNANHS